jgi:hypothetical protein
MLIVEISEDPTHPPLEPMRPSLSFPLMSNNNNPQSVRPSMNEHNNITLSKIPANYGRPSAPPALPVTRPKLTRSNGKRNLFQSTANRNAQIAREQNRNNNMKTKKSKRTWGQFFKNPFQTARQFEINKLASGTKQVRQNEKTKKANRDENKIYKNISNKKYAKALYSGNDNYLRNPVYNSLRDPIHNSVKPIQYNPTQEELNFNRNDINNNLEPPSRAPTASNKQLHVQKPKSTRRRKH